eukprot:4373004-Pleurochrysis_carterae.AAC.1
MATLASRAAREETDPAHDTIKAVRCGNSSVYSSSLRSNGCCGVKITLPEANVASREIPRFTAKAWLQQCGNNPEANEAPE